MSMSRTQGNAVRKAPAATDDRRPWIAAAGWLALLGPLFFVVYGWCNAVSAHRAHVGSFFFAWERQIPFVPWMVVPYVSVDLFFAGSFFLCRDRAQLRVHAARIGLAILISAAAFLLCPLRYGWTRPAVDGWLGVLFAPLNALDQPYNLCPSLHKAWRVACGGWFTLVGVSTLFIYQHHVIDLLGGYAVALVCRWCFPEKDASLPPVQTFGGKQPLLPCTPSSSLPTSQSA